MLQNIFFISTYQNNLNTLLSPRILGLSVMKEVCNPMAKKHGYENWNMVRLDESTHDPINSGLNHGQVS